MSHWKSFGLAIFAAVCLLGEATGSAHAQIATEWSDGGVIKLGGLPGSTDSGALAINNVGQVVGVSGGEAVEWSGGSVIDLGPGIAESINLGGQAAGYSPGLALWTATEWSGGSVIHLQNLPGATESLAYGINDAGQVVGASFIDGGVYATPPSGVGAASSTWEAFRARRITLPTAATTPDSRWDTVPAATTVTPPSGAMAASYPWAWDLPTA